MEKPTKAFHGGAFFNSIGASFEFIERSADVISADVLDAWYPPAPNILTAISDNLEWLVKTSPPTHGDGLREQIAGTRGLACENVLLGAGTSSLMFLTLPRIVSRGERVLVLDPSYGDYAHIIENVIGAELVRYELDLDSFEPDLVKLAAAARGVHHVILVNPNSPTGRLIGRDSMEEIIRSCRETRFWVDETYIDFPSCYAGGSGSLESLVREVSNLIVSKSMSKFYGLSGLRVGYLIADRSLVADLERFSPPWGIGMIGQIAGIEALRNAEYYAERARETHILAGELAAGLSALGFRPVPTTANFLLARTPNAGAARLCQQLAVEDIYIRDANNLSPRFRDNFVRIAVKSREQQARLLEAFSRVL